MMSILGRIGRDVEVRYLPDGSAVATLALAYDYGRKAHGEQYRPSQWVDATLWGKQAESLAPYLKKGGRVLAHIQDVHVEEYEKKDGTRAIKLAGRIAGIQLVEVVKVVEPARVTPPKQSFEDDIPF